MSPEATAVALANVGVRTEEDCACGCASPGWLGSILAGIGGGAPQLPAFRTGAAIQERCGTDDDATAGQKDFLSS